jgi:hypothetical protein
MKHLKSIWDKLLESYTGYDWEFVSTSDNKVKYRFTDVEDNEYLVEFKSLPSIRKDTLSTEWELTYFVHSNDHYSVSKLTGVNPYKICYTVLTDILIDFTKRYSWVKKIHIHGLSKDRERGYISQRTKIYIRHLERNPIPGYKLLPNYGNRINLVKI